ncbi:hypothetical protein HATV-3_gp78 [Haloarcula tailed virus 3]|uniref:Uncharacterized protein n=1 Tax=Haloarcula tailed virus 3 TaxID=2877990 RepID=A0AAE8Y1X6_9CAUD|nr:hypothetical protein M1M35_gp78 [Haloarcula tailed virus 3]UBF23428.1 hypothetical protein HATV-3_gp78 [Haloarcula tailed virus 3]
MPCEQCGNAVEMLEQEGGTEQGQFKETYECVNCAAKGKISGEASDSPTDWNRSGGVFK